jgi:hypothetical protein
MGQSFAPGHDDEPGDCLSSQFRLPTPVVILMALQGGSLRNSGFSSLQTAFQISASVTISSRMPRSAFRPSSAEGPAGLPLPDTDACSASVS